MSGLKLFFGNNRVLFGLFLLIALPCLIYMVQVRWHDTGWRYCIHSDGKGYYAYLPAIFIYGDTDYKFVDYYESRYYDPGNYVSFAANVDGKIVNKYWLGTSMLILPFFLSADFLAPLMNYPDDGYSFPYQAAVSIAAIFWLFLGCYWLFQLLSRFYQLNDTHIFIALVTFVFGTNLFYYVTAEPSMSHVYSFSCLSGFLFFLSKYIRLNSIRALWTAGLCAGMLLLIRPTNIILLFSFLILFKNLSEVRTFFTNLFSSIFFPLSFVLIAITVVFLQCYYFHFVSGKWWVDSYVNENFNFLQPELFNFLFSYRKGLFVYTPLAFLSIAGFIWVMRKSYFPLFTGFLVLLVYYYVLSSWWMWFYGGSFGMRAAIDSFPVLIIFLAFLLNQIKNLKVRWPVYLMISACLFLNLIQTYQYTHWILPWDNMTKEKYWKIFLHTSPDYIGVATPDN